MDETYFYESYHSNLGSEGKDIEFLRSQFFGADSISETNVVAKSLVKHEQSITSQKFFTFS